MDATSRQAILLRALFALSPCLRILPATYARSNTLRHSAHACALLHSMVAWALNMHFLPRTLSLRLTCDSMHSPQVCGFSSCRTTACSNIISYTSHVDAYRAHPL